MFFKYGVNKTTFEINLINQNNPMFILLTSLFKFKKTNYLRQIL
ncbi:MAG: hypothetical protein RLZZ529_1481 [Bacteroidota bacterium]|jgi:hypothetical protein